MKRGVRRISATSRGRGRSIPNSPIGCDAGPASHPIGDYPIDLPRPRDVAEIRLTPRFIELHTKIWRAMKEEVLKGYARQQRR